MRVHAPQILQRRLAMINTRKYKHIRLNFHTTLYWSTRDHIESNNGRVRKQEAGTHRSLPPYFIHSGHDRQVHQNPIVASQSHQHPQQILPTQPFHRRGPLSREPELLVVVTADPQHIPSGGNEVSERDCEELPGHPPSVHPLLSLEGHTSHTTRNTCIHHQSKV
jgi:hypothetical protein